MSAPVTVEAPPATETVPVKGMKKNGMRSIARTCATPPSNHLRRQAMARQQGSIPPTGKPIFVGEAPGREEGSCCSQGKGKGAQGGEGGRETGRQCDCSTTRHLWLTTKQRRVEAIKTKRAAKEERERFAKMEEKMHKRRVERLKRKEKRNKMLKS